MGKKKRKREDKKISFETLDWLSIQGRNLSYLFPCIKVGTICGTGGGGDLWAGLTPWQKDCKSIVSIMVPSWPPIWVGGGGGGGGGMVGGIYCTSM
jgi:hypothetical protein